MNETKISVIYRGYSAPNVNKVDIKWENYILYVGNRNGYKNFIRFIEACAPILKSQKKLYLFCTGNEFSKDEFNLLSKHNIARQVIHKKVSESQLQSLYNNALFFIFPSLKEGFGLPILEAWGNNCPVALSNTDLFREIAGDAAVYFDPLDSMDIQNCIVNLLSGVDLRKSLVEKGKERVKQFSWEQSTREYERIYRDIFNQTN